MSGNEPGDDGSAGEIPPPSWAGAPPAPPLPGWSPPSYGWSPYVAPQAPRPGVIPLRPLGVGDLLEGSFKMIQRYPAATLGFAAAAGVVIAIIRFVAMSIALRGTHVPHLTILFGVSFGANGTDPRVANAQNIVTVVSLVANILLTGVLATVTGQAALGRPMGFRAAWQKVRPRLLRLTGATICVALAVGAGALIGGLVGIVMLLASLASDNAILFGFGAVIAVIAGSVGGLYVVTSLAFTTPVLVLEEVGIRTAMSRSHALVRTSWWRTFGIVLLAGLLGGIAGGLVKLPFLGVGALVLSSGGSAHHTTMALVLVCLGDLASATASTPFVVGVASLLYVDRRIRTERLDVTLAQAASAATVGQYR